MVKLHLGSCHPQFRDCIIEAGIRIQDESSNCTEYAFDDGSTDRSYVASKPGMQYMINVHVDNPAWRHMSIRSISSGQAIIQVAVHIDGGLVLPFLISQNGSAEIKDQLCGDSRYNFVFDTPKIVSDGGISDKNLTDKIGTIEVSFQVMIAASLAAPQRATVAPSESSLTINERAKKGALISSTTRFSLAATSPISIWNSTYFPGDRPVGHTFHYKTEDFLEIEGVLPGSNPADDAPESNATPPQTNTTHAKIEAKKEENEEEDAIEFVSSTPVVKRPVELVDLTTTTSEPKRRGRTSSSSTVIDVDAPVVVKREKTFTRKNETKVEIVDLT
ncbi:hypothetical protein HDU80_007198 [Chytriomyces hyalinus]|nr:hypothetical protein HDU80_007198 [Chytriomyces hyalinus]